MRRLGVALVTSGVVCGVLLACGARTGLPIGHHEDASVDVIPDRGIDAQVFDAPPPLDVHHLDVQLANCPVGSRFVYVVTETDELVAFDPPTVSFKPIGTLVCPVPSGFHPFSMAVDRNGDAYVLYSAGTPNFAQLVKVNTKDASCTATSYVPQYGDFGKFGMGFASQGLNPQEDLYVASWIGSSLCRVNVGTDFGLDNLAKFDPAIIDSELTGTGDGRLFAFFATTSTGGNETAIAEIDRASGKVLAQDDMPGVSFGTAWAFATWGGYFWLFVNPAGQKVVRWDPETHSATVFNGYKAPIVGAGVSTCAPL
ncbi:hypothetical protein BH09MYX1_BH09MYX1_18130 [soil metagenome]